jgi:hypothetical protein
MAKEHQLTVRKIAELIRRPYEEMGTVVDRIRGWSDVGLIKVRGSKFPGTGSKRRYGAEAVIDAMVLTAITDLGLAAVRVGHFSGDDESIIDLCRTAALTVLGDNEQRDAAWMLIISPPSPEAGRSSARFAYKVGRPSTTERDDHWLDVPMPSILESAIILNLTQIFKPLRSILEVVRPEPPGFPGFRLKENME